MTPFTGPVSITELDAQSTCWFLNSRLQYDLGEPGSGRTIVVPRGFVTDGASVPRFLQAIIPAWGNYSRPAILHDYLCALLRHGKPHPLAPTRQDADRIFLEAMRALEVNWFTRTLLYVGAVLGGYTPGVTVNTFLWSPDDPEPVEG